MKKRNIYQLSHYGRLAGAPRYQDFTGVACDSRLVVRDNLFFALKGGKTDGHLYLKDAAEKGAVAAVVRNDYDGPHFGITLLYVADPLDTLQQLARDVLAQQHCKVAAITGSVGKTTTKEFMYTILSGKYRTLRTPGNANSQIGLPLALLNGLAGDEEIVICEMGMTHPGNIQNLTRIAPPYLGIITGVEYVHACNFEGLAGIAEAKAEILTHPSTAFALVNSSVPNIDKILSKKHPKVFTFGAQGNDGYFKFETNPQGNLQVLHEGEILAGFPPLSLPGKHNATNFLIAAASGYLLGMQWDEIALRQPLLRLPERRLQFVEKNGVLYVNDSYNASLVAVKAALDSLPEPNGQGRKFAALGEMLELGELTEPHHRAVGEHALPLLDGIFCLGEGCRGITDVWKGSNKPCQLYMDQEDLIHALRNMLREGDVVLVKGSRLKQMWRVIDEI